MTRLKNLKGSKIVLTFAEEIGEKAARKLKARKST